MNRNRILLALPGFFLVLSTCATISLAYGSSHPRKNDETHSAKLSNSDNHPKSRATHAVKLSNSGNQPLKDITVSFSGKDPDAFRQTNDCVKDLNKGKSCVISVSFSPKNVGEKSAAMEVVTSEGKQIVYLTGTGI